ncbi:MAG: PAS domain S-box protein [Verrucomicrobia bacterium]|nr:PAS domain S-box protein [Verrucomicrobiota bacterium]
MSKDTSIFSKVAGSGPVSGLPLIHVLLIEDNPADALLIQAMLSEPSSARFEVTHAASLGKGLECLAKGSFGVVLLDLSLPDSFGLETFDIVRAQAPAMPILVMSGLDDENAAVNAVHSGAQDYLVKGSVDSPLLARSLRYAIERKRAEEALRHSEAFYQSLVDNLPQFILRKDPQGRFTFGNQKFLAELGRPMEEIVGKSDFDFFPPELAEKYQRDDRVVMQTGQVFETVEEHEPPGGGKRYVQVVKTPIRDRDKQVIGIQGIFWDVTERKLAEERIQQANADLARSREEVLKALSDLREKHNEVKEAHGHIIQMERTQIVGRLAAGFALEMKGALDTARAGFDQLKALPGAPAAATLDSTEALRRADTILNGLLDFVSPGKLELVPADLNAVLEASLQMLEHELKDGGCTAVRELDPNLPKAFVDGGRIKQVLVSLLTNAIEAMPGGGTITVRTRFHQPNHGEVESDNDRRVTRLLRRAEPSLILEIEDTGTGIPPEKLSRIFDPFFTVKPAGKGTGLGLTVTKKVIEMHGGNIAIQNRRGGSGVCATVILKAAAPPDAAKANPDRG